MRVRMKLKRGRNEGVGDINTRNGDKGGCLWEQGLGYFTLLIKHNIKY